MTEIKRIHQLPSYLANQISAGEVIERPASVLKELLENSLDAYTTQIEIKVEQGGIGLIRVQDNGVGICKEDLALSLAPHATSKIETLSDLENVGSYGFRGEALASIGSVSRLQLSSSIPEQEFGWCIQMAGREGASTLSPTPKRLGTLVEVRDLFYNTPARRKFLRSEKTETAYLEETFKKIALSQPAVAFKFQAGERLQKRLPACQDLEGHSKRVATLCGQSFIKEAYYIQAESNGLRLKGWLGSPKAMRSQPDLQYFYVNGRIVRDKVVMHAVRQAYQEVALPGRYPAYVLYFELDPASLDVNVHPTKHEVRFREARTVHAFLSYAIQEGLKQGKETETVKMDLSFLTTHKKAQEVKEDKQNLETKTDFIKPLFLLGGELLLAKNNHGLVIVDVKAIRRLLIRDQLTDAYHLEGVSKRPLLMPKSMVVGKSIEKLESLEANLDRLGFEITPMGYDLILLRTVPIVFGSKMDGLEDLIPNLLMLSNAESCIDLIVDHIIQYQNLSEDEIEQWLVELQKTKISQKNPQFPKYYRQVTIEQLRAVFA